MMNFAGGSEDKKNEEKNRGFLSTHLLVYWKLMVPAGGFSGSLGRCLHFAEKQSVYHNTKTNPCFHSNERENIAESRWPCGLLCKAELENVNMPKG